MITTKKKNPIIILVTSASAVVTLASALSTDATETMTDFESRVDATIHEGDDDDGHFYIPHEGNSTLSATFSIRVTPEHYHVFSWTILWLCFASAVAFGIYQLKLERRWMKYSLLNSASSSNKNSSRYSLSSKRKHPNGSPNPSDPELGGRKNYTRSGGRLVRSSSRVGGSRDRMITSASSASINSNHGNQGEEQSVSSGDLARATVRCE